ncbi:MAG: class I SAM-dependent methyltransferase [Deltaproteobacteria bacterium]|nr:class I SAM-dependent methyltransferase [Deltaproteobacteria bacterium]
MKDFHRALADFMKGLKPGRLLDAGSGSGELASALKESGFDVLSLDLYAMGKGGSGFVVADLDQSLPFLGKSFDYIVCSEVIQYLENHAALFREFKRALKDGGSVILSIPNTLHAGSRFYFLRRGYYPHFKPVRTVDPSKPWDSLAYNPASMVDLLGIMGKTGFELACVKASRLKRSGLAVYLLLKAAYSMGLLFERRGEKAGLSRLLSSKDLLLGDHLIIQARLRVSMPDKC